MNVYVVLWTYKISGSRYLSVSSIEGIFDTIEKAKEWIKNQELDLNYEIEEWLVE